MPAFKPKKQDVRGKQRQRGPDEESITEGAEDDYADTKAVKPKDQLDLTEEELKEEITRILTANNPHAPQNIVRYNYKERCFKPVPIVNHLAIHFSLDGNLLHEDSVEAKEQVNRMRGISAPPDEHQQPTTAASSEKIDAEKDEVGGEGTDKASRTESKDEERDEVVATPVAPKETKLTNQFNFSERASQTYNNPFRERGTNTDPPPRQIFSGNATQWEIYDAYQEDFEEQERRKEEGKKKESRGTGSGKDDGDKGKKKFSVLDSQTEDLSKIGSLCRIVERMVNQNSYDEISQDFRYWEDPSDEFREQEGTLLPLWRFGYEGAKRLAVTSLSWNHRYKDLFAVGHGSYEFLKQSNGLILMYSLKNPSFPEFRVTTESGVMSLDIHPEQPYLVAAGFYNGSVAVYNVTLDREHDKNPVYTSSARIGKHTDPVWQVTWQRTDVDGHLNFFSVGADGLVIQWTLVKNELTRHDIVRLKMPEPAVEGPDHTLIETLGCGTCIDFHKESDYLFLVGTEEGRVHKCSKSYQNTYINTVEAHHMAVYKIEWNPYHPDVFITCSADWSVKIWDHNHGTPMFTYDLGSPVGDVSWAPYSSTVFAAVTNDGKVSVFDLNINKYDPICQQAVVQKKKTKLTHISFNPSHPIVIVGDDRGHVISLKLSPNLRKLPKIQQSLAESLAQEKKGGGGQKLGPEYEVQKMDKILALVREPGSSGSTAGTGGSSGDHD